MNIFEKALREKYRFNFRGSVQTEDLFDLSTSQLNSIYESLASTITEDNKKSLLSKPTAQDLETKTKMEIVKYIFDAKVLEAKEKEEALAKKQEIKKLEGLLAKKQDDALENLSAEELQAKLSELKG